ncbi:14232_t:CDS:2 [Funneliformis geosporum]|nr:14232_t:CDS:2 [Funneliformis geosporum]
MASLFRTNLLRSIRPMYTLAKVPKTLTATLAIRTAPTRLNFSLPISRRFTATGLRLNTVPVPKDIQVDKELAIEDKSGINEVALTRTFGNEKIRLLFDINTSDQQTEPLSFPGDEDEEAGKGALAIESIIADGVFLINYVSYYRDANVANDWTAEADWKRRGFYPGPQFETLDNDVQVLFEKYLEERGINTAVAVFIPNYVEYKEQKEYLTWLEKVKKFIESP